LQSNRAVLNLYDRGRVVLYTAKRIADHRIVRANVQPHAGKALVALIGTAVSHFCFVTTVYCLARCFGIVPTGEQTQGELYLATLIATVVGSLFAAIPISVQGFGQLEAVFYKILVEGGWCVESAMIVLTISARLVQVFWSLPGVIAPWLGLERPTLSAEDQEAMPTRNGRANRVRRTTIYRKV